MLGVPELVDANFERKRNTICLY